MKIEYVDISELKIPQWRATYILRPDLAVIAASIGEFGLLNPLIVQTESNIIIDGSVRYSVISEIQALRARFISGIPVIYVDCDDSDAMILHIQMNRGRGFIVPHRLSKIVKLLKHARRFTNIDFRQKFNMKLDELDLLLDGTFIKHRNTKDHTYSKAWVPIEAPANTIEKNSITIEKPPNADH